MPVTIHGKTFKTTRGALVALVKRMSADNSEVDPVALANAVAKTLRVHKFGPGGERALGTLEQLVEAMRTQDGPGVERYAVALALDSVLHNTGGRGLGDPASGAVFQAAYEEVIAEAAPPAGEPDEPDIGLFSESPEEDDGNNPWDD